MNYHDITKDDMKNGDGLRVVLWVSGCSHGCLYCQNPVTWNPNDGLLFDEAAYHEISLYLQQDYISGITLSGGDPLYEANRADILTLCKRIHDDFPQKSIWMYTGYSFEEIKDLPVLKYVDVLIDGRYEHQNRDVKLKWRGSSNQRVINVHKSFEQNEVVLYCD